MTQNTKEDEWAEDLPPNRLMLQLRRNLKHFIVLLNSFHLPMMIFIHIENFILGNVSIPMNVGFAHSQSLIV
jgi:hypothetical protein